MVKKTIILLFFLQFYLTSLRGKEYFCQGDGVEAGCFWPLGAVAARKKIPGAGAGAAKKFAGSPALPTSYFLYHM